MLNRNATATEIAAGENGLTAGESELDLRSRLAHSSEEYNDLNNAFISATGAPGSPLEIANYQNSIAYSPNNQETVRSWIAYSPTTVQQIYQIYQNIFQSQPSAADLGAREASIQAGATLANLTQSLAQYAGSNVNQVYWNIVGRAPLASEMSGAIANLGAGYTLSQAEGWLAASNECQNAVNNMFVSILNHSSDWNTLTGYQNSLASGNSLTVERSWVAYGMDAQNEIIGNFQDEVGTTPMSSQVGQYEAYCNSGGGLYGLWGVLSHRSAPLITTIFNNQLGRNPTSSETASVENYFAGGATQANIMSSEATTPEAVNDISSSFLRVAGTTIDTPTLSTAQSILGNNGNIASACGVFIASPSFQNNLDSTYDQVLGTDPTNSQLATVTSELSADVTTASSGLTWSQLASDVENGFTKFLNEANPIGSAIAATRGTSLVQQAANLAAARAIVSNTNNMAFLHAVAAAEHAGTFNPTTTYNTINGLQQPVSSLASYPTSISASTAAGAYQIVQATLLGEQNRLGLYDWSVSTQDLMAADLLNSHGGVAALNGGNLPLAILDASKVWAAVPESASQNYSRFFYSSGPYAGQRQPSIDYTVLVKAYHSNGGQ